jgi:hypothetical protein
VFNAQPWNTRVFDPDFVQGPPSNLLFELHTTCAIRANDKLSTGSSEIFHISWIDLQRLPDNATLSTSIHKNWQRQHLQWSRELAIGVVAGSVSLNDSPE